MPAQPDPARLTEQEVRGELEAAISSYTNVSARDAAAYRVLASHKLLEARLAAAENVVEAARGVAYSKPSDLSRLASALAAYDAHKREPTGNHAESSQARGDTNK